MLYLQYMNGVGDRVGSPEAREESNLTFPGYRFAAEVAREKLWRNKDEKGNVLVNQKDRIVDEERIVEIAKKELPESNEDVALPEHEILQQEAIKGVHEYISNAIKIGMLSPEVIALTNRMNLPEDIRIIGEGDRGINIDRRYDSSQFPEDGHRPDIILTPSIIKNRVEHYAHISSELNLGLSMEQIRRVAIGAVAVHEWSHSLERALKTDYEGKIRRLGEYDPKKDLLTASGLAQKIVFREAADITLSPVAGLEERNVGFAHTEQFATGFELDATRVALEHTGISVENANLFVEKLESARAKRLVEFRKLYQNLGMSNREMESFFFDMAAVLKRNQIDISYIPDLWKGLGYLQGYNTAALEVMVKRAYERLQNDDLIKQDFLEEKKQRNFQERPPREDEKEVFIPSEDDLKKQGDIVRESPRRILLTTYIGVTDFFSLDKEVVAELFKELPFPEGDPFQKKASYILDLLKNGKEAYMAKNPQATYIDLDALLKA